MFPLNEWSFFQHIFKRKLFYSKIELFNSFLGRTKISERQFQVYFKTTFSKSVISNWEPAMGTFSMQMERNWSFYRFKSDGLVWIATQIVWRPLHLRILIEETVTDFGASNLVKLFPFISNFILINFNFSLN